MNTTDLTLTPDSDPVTADWLRSEGLLPDDSETGELAVKFDGAMPGEHNELVWAQDGSLAVECYDDDGKSLEVLSIGSRTTVGEMRLLFRALRCWTASNWREGITRKDDVPDAEYVPPPLRQRVSFSRCGRVVRKEPSE